MYQGIFAVRAYWMGAEIIAVEECEEKRRRQRKSNKTWHKTKEWRD